MDFGRNYSFQLGLFLICLYLCSATALYPQSASKQNAPAAANDDDSDYDEVSPSVQAQSLLPQASRVQVNTQYNLYQSSDGLLVQSPKASLQANLDERTQLAMNYTVDSVSAASFNYAQSKTHRNDPDRSIGSCYRCHNPADALSGATHHYLETRQEYVIGIKRQVSETALKAAYSRSVENDYISDDFTLGIEQALASRDTTLSLTFQHLSDSINPVINRSFSAGLATNGLDLSLTQILTRFTEVRLGAAWALAQGYQADPYAFIEVGGNKNITYPSVQPDSKQRLDATLSLKQALPWQSALQLDYRYYVDDWDVHAHTVDFTLSKQILGWVLEPEYRYYIQSQAYFFQNFYNQVQTYMTRDLKLADFSTHFLSLALRGLLAQGWSAELRYSHFLRVDNLDYSTYFGNAPTQADLVQLGLTLQ